APQTVGGCQRRARPAGGCAYGLVQVDETGTREHALRGDVAVASAQPVDEPVLGGVGGAGAPPPPPPGGGPPPPPVRAAAPRRRARSPGRGPRTGRPRPHARRRSAAPR